MCIHFAPVHVFGEVEFVVSTLKIIAVITFLIVIWVIMGGTLLPTPPHHPSTLFH